MVYIVCSISNGWEYHLIVSLVFVWKMLQNLEKKFIFLPKTELLKLTMILLLILYGITRTQQVENVAVNRKTLQNINKTRCIVQ